MKNYLLILPVALLVTYSQIIVKWRTIGSTFNSVKNEGIFSYLLKFLLDPIILSAYATALIASFAWLFIVTKLPLTTAFPIYIGATFCMVLVGGWFFLAEAISPIKVLSILLIFSGIVLGLKG